MQLEKNKKYNIDYKDQEHNQFDYTGPAKYTGKSMIYLADEKVYEFEELTPKKGFNTKGWFLVNNVISEA